MTSYEDIGLIKSIESILKKSRGYVFRMPKPDSAVILLLSGGVDSVVTWGRLMKKYRVVVYPVVLGRQRLWPNRTQLSVEWYSRYYADRFPKYFRKPYYSDSPISSQRLVRDTLMAARGNKEFLFDHIDAYQNISIEPQGFMTELGIVGANYSQLLKARDDVDVDTVFCSVVPRDAETMRSQTMTHLRLAMLLLIQASGSKDFQYTSIVLEPEMGKTWGKQELVAWAKKHRIPLEYSDSCIGRGWVHCGRCPACEERKYDFVQGWGDDLTVYADKDPWSDQLRYVLRRYVDYFFRR